MTLVQQNTEFSLVVLPERCATGKQILRDRAAHVKAAKTMDEFFVVEGRGWLKYCRHVAKCETCQDYEAIRRADQDKRFLNSMEKK